MMGIGQDVPNQNRPDIYCFGLVTIGEDSVIPSNVQIGKNTAIAGVTEESDYPNGVLPGGATLIKTEGGV
jgi:glucose-1-phosphate adenylyltransferase